MMYKFFFLTIIIFTIGCSLDLPPEDEVSDPNAITSVITAERSLASAYASYKPYNYAVDWVLRSDDVVPTEYLSRDITLKNTYDWTERTLINHSEDIWKALYATIAQCNVLLERLPNVSPSTPGETRDLQLIKQRATYLKALCYFDLLKIFSPAFLAPNSQPYGILIKDKFTLTNQQDRLSFQASVNEIKTLLEISALADSNTYYITPETAQYIKAELALWTNDNAQAIALALPLYEQYKNQLTTSPITSIWKNNTSPLRLFALDTRAITSSPFQKIEYNENIGDYVAVSNTISYTTTDVRFDEYTIADAHNAQRRLLGKYRKQFKAREQMQYYTVTRVSALVFLLSEAYVKQGDKQHAFEVLNTLLTARNTSTQNPTTTDRATLLNIILAEKQKEFIGEPVRFFDLKRNLLPIQRILSGTTLTIQPTDMRWTLPIPASEKRYNPAITQNTGWNIGGDIE